MTSVGGECSIERKVGNLKCCHPYSLWELCP